MDMIFDQAKDKNVAFFVAYGKSADSKLYYEAAYTNQVNRSDAEDAFLKNRLIIKVGDAYFRPTSLSNHKIKTVDVTTVSSTATPSFVEWLTKDPV